MLKRKKKGFQAVSMPCSLNQCGYGPSNGERANICFYVPLICSFSKMHVVKNLV